MGAAYYKISDNEFVMRVSVLQDTQGEFQQTKTGEK